MHHPSPTSLEMSGFSDAAILRNWFLSIDRVFPVFFFTYFLWVVGIYLGILEHVPEQG